MLSAELGQGFASVPWLLDALRLLIGCATISHVLLHKANSVAALGWILFVCVFPLIGSVLYWYFGVNRISAAAAQASTQHLKPAPLLRPSGADQADPAAGSQQSHSVLQRVGQQVVRRAPVAGNMVLPLYNGEQAFPSMLAAIGKAQREVLLSTYLFEPDSSGERFVHALRAANARGARICILLDDVGRRHNFPTIVRSLRDAGLEYQLFLPLRLLPPSLSTNLRNHRKILIVDQQLAFAGGMNIGDRQLAQGASEERASDLHFRFSGPIVAQLRQVFAADWQFSGGAELGPDAAPGIFAEGFPSACRLIVDGPNEQLDRLSYVLEGVISAARTRVLIVTPYFLPEERLIGALQSAAFRGVEVTVLVPQRCNWPIVRWALDHQLPELLSNGIRFLEQPPPFAHTKCLLIDDSYALVGSANLDARSLRLNFELGVELFGKPLVQELTTFAQGIAAQSRAITPARNCNRALWKRLRDASAALLSPYL